MVQSSGRWGFDAIVECLSRLCRYLVLVWDTEHLFAMRGLDSAVKGAIIYK